MNKFLVILISVIVLTGCAQTRDPRAVSIKQSGDDSMTCEQLVVEYTSNTSIAEYKISKNNSDDQRDILVGALIWPGLADFKNADGIEGNGLLDRNIYLMSLARLKGCDVRSWPYQPIRYT